MPLAPVKNFFGPSYSLASLNVACQRSQNLISEVMEVDGEPQAAFLRGRPGLGAALCTLPTQPLRCLWGGGAPLSNAGRLFAVSGSKLYEVGSDGSIVGGVNRGEVGNDGYPAQIFANGDQILVVSAGNAYIDNGGTASGSNAVQISVADARSGVVSTFIVASRGAPIYQVKRVSGDQFDSTLVGETITITIPVGSPAVPTPTAFTVARVYSPTSLTVTTSAGTHTNAAYTTSYSHSLTARTGAFLDSFFVLAQMNSKQFSVSAPNDGTSWDPTDVATKESYPDNIGAILADHQELLICGESHSEVWTAPGADPNFPFQPNEAYAMNLGIAAPWSLNSLRDGPVWIAASERGLPIAYFAKGFVPVRISTHAIEQAWAAYAPLYAAADFGLGVPLCSDAQAFVMELDGHELWCVSLPLADATWVYDATASGQAGKPYWYEWTSAIGDGHNRFRGCCHASVWSMHLVGDFATGAIYPLSSTVYRDAGSPIICQKVFPHFSEQRLREFFLRAQLDLETGGAALTVVLEWSDNGGHTFVGGGDAFTWTTSTTNTLERVSFPQLGSAQWGDRVFRLTVAGNSRVALRNFFLDTLTGLS